MKIYLAIIMILVTPLFADKAIEPLPARFKKKMVAHINSDAFEKQLKKKITHTKLSGADREFFVAGYIRAWISYTDISVYKSGAGLGNIQGFNPGKLALEFDGWLQGCNDASKQGDKFEEESRNEVLDILERDE